MSCLSAGFATLGGSGASSATGRALGFRGGHEAPLGNAKVFMPVKCLKLRPGILAFYFGLLVSLKKELSWDWDALAPKPITSDIFRLQRPLKGVARCCGRHGKPVRNKEGGEWCCVHVLLSLSISV